MDFNESIFPQRNNKDSKVTESTDVDDAILTIQKIRKLFMLSGMVMFIDNSQKNECVAILSPQDIPRVKLCIKFHSKISN